MQVARHFGFVTVLLMIRENCSGRARKIQSESSLSFRRIIYCARTRTSSRRESTGESISSIRVLWACRGIMMEGRSLRF